MRNNWLNIVSWKFLSRRLIWALQEVLRAVDAGAYQAIRFLLSYSRVISYWRRPGRQRTHLGVKLWNRN